MKQPLWFYFNLAYLGWNVEKFGSFYSNDLSFTILTILTILTSMATFDHANHNEFITKIPYKLAHDILATFCNYCFRLKTSSGKCIECLTNCLRHFRLFYGINAQNIIVHEICTQFFFSWNMYVKRIYYNSAKWKRKVCCLNLLTIRRN